MFYVVIKPRGRLPAMNSFVATRISGPGLAANYFYQTTVDIVLLSLQVFLEQIEVGEFRNNMQLQVRKPGETLRKIYAQTFGLLGLGVNSSHAMWKTIEEREARLNKLLEEEIARDYVNRKFTSSVSNYTSNIRLTRDDLETFLEQAEELITTFLPRITRWANEAELWRSKTLEEGDWKGLTRFYIVSVFGNGILEPLEEADASFSLKVDHLDTKQFMSTILSTKPTKMRDDLDSVAPRYTYKAASIACQVTSLNSVQFNSYYGDGQLMQQMKQSSKFP